MFKMDAEKPPLKNLVWQVVAAFIAHSLAIQAGINLAYSTILLPQIMDTGASLPNEKDPMNSTDFEKKLLIDKDEASWVASLVAIATPVGSLLTGPLMDRFGRKKVCIFTAIPFVISWTLIANTTVSVYTIYVARILAGVAGGLSTAAIVYVAEISHPSIRPMLLSLTSVFVSFGILLTSLLSYFLTWKVVAICCGFVALGSFLLNFFIPETPSWIVGFQTSKNSPDKGLKSAEKSLKWLYKNTNDYRKELEALEKIKNQKTAEKEGKLIENLNMEKNITLRSPQVWKPLLCLFILFTLQQFSGAYIIIFYAVQNFEMAGSVEVNQLTSVVILGIIRFVMAIISTFLSKRFGRRPLMMTSAFGMGITMLGAGAWLNFHSHGLFPVICLLLFVMFGSYGVSVVPWTIIGELLPLNFRAKGSGCLVAVAYIHMFLTVKFFIVTVDCIGIVSVFIGFSMFSFLIVVFVYFQIPETLGKTFQEIESCFK